MDGRWLRSKHPAVSSQAFQHVRHLGISSRVKLPVGSSVLHLPLSEPCLGKAGGKAQDEA